MTLEQKCWRGGLALFRAVRPFLLYILVPALCMSVGYLVTGPDMTTQEFFIYGSNFYTALGMALTLWLLYENCRRKGKNFFDETTLYAGRLSLKKGAVFFAFGASSSVLVSAVITLIPFAWLTASYEEASSRMYGGRDLLFVIFTTVFSGPLLEEIVFRGYMLNRLLEFFSERTSVIFVSVSFALCHGNLIWILYAFVMGIIMTKISMKEDNIAGTVAMHMGFNFPSAVICVLNQFEYTNTLFFGSSILIFTYGLLAALALVLLIRCLRNEWDR